MNPAPVREEQHSRFERKASSNWDRRPQERPQNDSKRDNYNPIIITTNERGGHRVQDDRIQRSQV